MADREVREVREVFQADLAPRARMRAHARTCAHMCVCVKNLANLAV